jgi:hypothetical protein
MAARKPLVLAGGEPQQIQSGDTLDVAGDRVVNAADPTSAQDLTTKNYADSTYQLNLISSGPPCPEVMVDSDGSFLLWG